VSECVCVCVCVCVCLCVCVCGRMYVPAFGHESVINVDRCIVSLSV